MKLGVRSAWALLRAAAKGWKEDRCVSMGAALAFYSMLSMAPLMVLVITVAGLLIGRDEAQQLLLTQLSGLLGETGGEGVKNVLEGASDEQEGLTQSAISAAILLLGATRILGELQENLNRIFKLEAPKSGGVWRAIRKKLLSLGLIIVLALLLVGSLAVSAAVSYVGSVWFGGAEAIAHGLELLGSFLLTTLVFGVAYKFLPAKRLPWSDVVFGAIATAILFGIGKFLIGLYLGKSAVASDFGAAGTLVVVIVWVYYTSQILFFGAELTKAYSMGVGSQRVEEAANSDFDTDEAEMIARARRIVGGSDPVVAGKRA